jgi:hypothetical protein
MVVRGSSIYSFFFVALSAGREDSMAGPMEGYVNLMRQDIPAKRPLVLLYE